MLDDDHRRVRSGWSCAEADDDDVVDRLMVLATEWREYRLLFRRRCMCGDGQGEESGDEQGEAVQVGTVLTTEEEDDFDETEEAREEEEEEECLRSRFDLTAEERAEDEQVRWWASFLSLRDSLIGVKNGSKWTKRSDSLTLKSQSSKKSNCFSMRLTSDTPNKPMV